jgi:tetratricopeptide (TPR) repeat protein
VRTAFLLLLAMLCLGGAAYLRISDHQLPQVSETTRENLTSSDAEPSVNDTVSESAQQPTPQTSADQVTPPDPPLTSVEHSLEGQEDIVSPTDSFTRAVAAFDAGRYEEAKDLFLDAADLDARALSGAGLSAFKLRDWEGAIHHLGRAVESGQDGFLQHKFLALAHNRLDNLERSLSHADAALARQKDREMELFRAKLVREHEARKGFIAEETAHFKTQYDGYVHGSVNLRILDILEDAYRKIGGRLDFYPDDTVTVVLYTERAFFDVTLLPVWTAGAFDGRIHLPIGGLEDIEEHFLRTVLYHEYVHALVHRMAHGVPHWMNEGLADYLVNRDLPRTGQDIPLQHLEQGFPLDDNSVMMRAYAVSSSAVAHLVEEHGLWRMRDFLLSMGRGRTLDEAFQEAFYTSYADFLATWGRRKSSLISICDPARYPV